MPESPETVTAIPTVPLVAPGRTPLSKSVQILGFLCFLLLGMVIALNFRRLSSPAVESQSESIATLAERLRHDAGEIADRTQALETQLKAKDDELARQKAALLEAEAQNRALIAQVGQLKADRAAGDSVDLKRQLDEANRAKAFFESRVKELEAKAGGK